MIPYRYRFVNGRTIRMKILNLHGVGDIRLEEREIGEMAPGEVLLKIGACGICSSDEARIFETGTYHFPTVPGHEFAGTIVDAADEEGKKLVGRKASVFPMLPCMECESCKRREYETCSNYKYFGSRNDGAFAEYLSVPVWNLNLIEDHVDIKVAALSEPAAVSLHAAKKGRIKEGDDVAVIGTGAIGLMIACFARNMGGKVTVFGRRESSLAPAKELGFAIGDSSSLEQDDPSFDCVFEAVGTNQAMTQAILATRAGGTVVAVGNPHGDFALTKDVYWKILRRQLNLVGTWNSSFKGETEDDWKDVARLMAEGDIPFEKLITKTFSLDEYKEAFDFLRDKSVSKSRGMFVMD